MSVRPRIIVTTQGPGHPVTLRAYASDDPKPISTLIMTPAQAHDIGVDLIIKVREATRLDPKR